MAADGACQILGYVDVEGHWRLRQQGAIDVLIRHPDDITGLVVEGAEDVGDVGFLSRHLVPFRIAISNFHHKKIVKHFHLA